MKKFKIDKNIPLPNMGKKYGAVDYPFSIMEIHDSFFIAVKNDDVKKTTARIRASCISYNKSQGKYIKIAIRVVEKGIRIWRIK